MKDWLYQIKGKDTGSGIGNWSWPPLATGKVEAPDRAAAKALVEAEYEQSFPTRVLKKELDSNEFLLVLKEIAADDHYTRGLFEVRTCRACGAMFKMIEKYAVDNPGGGHEFCSRSCSAQHYQVDGYGGNYPPVIYRITNKKTGLCYIGKTRQAFTLRWYQHFFQTSDTKFHEVIKTYPVTDWMFEILEMVVVPPDLKDVLEKDRFICGRESEWIEQFNSVANGYNTAGGSKNEPSLVT